MVLFENQRDIDGVSKHSFVLNRFALEIIVPSVFCKSSFFIYVVFTLDIKHAKGLASAPLAFLPLIFASNITVPVPQKGSRTTPFLGQK